MILVCPGCKNQITLDDATIPDGGFKVRCTGCGRSINAQKKVEPTQQQQQSSSIPLKQQPVADKGKTQTTAPDAGRIPPELQTFVNSQIAAAKQEILHAMQTLFGGSSAQKLPGSGNESLIASNTALVCSGDGTTTEALLRLLKPMGYHLQSLTSAAESLKAVDLLYELIVIDPSFTDDLEGAKKMIGRINSKKAADRRKVFVVLLSSTQKSLDGNSAFLGGVNLVVNKADLDQIESFIRQGQTYFQKLYSTLENAG